MQHAWRLSRTDAARVKWLLAQPKPCLLCNTFPMAYNGIFQPTKSEIWGGEAWERAAAGLRALCAQCTAMPDLTLHVEARPMRGVVGRGH